MAFVTMTERPELTAVAEYRLMVDADGRITSAQPIERSPSHLVGVCTPQNPETFTIDLGAPTISSLWLVLLDEHDVEITDAGYRRARIPATGYGTIENPNLEPWTVYKWAVFDTETGGRMVGEPRWIDREHRRVEIHRGETVSASLDGIMSDEQMSFYLSI